MAIPNLQVISSSAEDIILGVDGAVRGVTLADGRLIACKAVILTTGFQYHLNVTSNSYFNPSSKVHFSVVRSILDRKVGQRAVKAMSQPSV